jgi:hypothetical protein
MTLEEMYFAMKGPLAAAGGYGELDDEQRGLFDAAIDALMAAKFAEGGPTAKEMGLEADEAVTQFLGAMPPEPESEESEESEEEGESPVTRFESLLIRASDALDRAGQRKLADELDAILGTGRKT